MIGVRQRKSTFQEKLSSEIRTKTKQAVKQRNYLSQCFLTLFFGGSILAALCAISYYSAPFTALHSKDFSVKVDLVGPLALNRRLTKGSKISGLAAPESVAEDSKGNLFASLADGRIVAIAPSEDGKVGAGKQINFTTIAFPTAPKAVKQWNHGRPLGLRIRGDTLFVADANYGILSIDLQTKQITPLVSVKDVSPPLGLPNDLDVTKDGNYIYFSDSSSKYHWNDLLFINTEGVCDARIFRYNLKTKEIRLVASQLCYANGIQLFEDEMRMFVTETFRYRMRVFDLTTWETLQFIDAPVMVDNIRPTGRGTYWIAGGYTCFDLFSFLERNPTIRQILAGLLGHEGLRRAIDLSYNIVIEMKEDGEFLQSLHDSDGSLTYGLSQATQLSDGRLALGSHSASFLGISDGKDAAIGL